jgi:hypothetical protein
VEGHPCSVITWNCNFALDREPPRFIGQALTREQQESEQENQCSLPHSDRIVWEPQNALLMGMAVLKYDKRCRAAFVWSLDEAANELV